MSCGPLLLLLLLLLPPGAAEKGRSSLLPLLRLLWPPWVRRHPCWLPACATHAHTHQAGRQPGQIKRALWGVSASQGPKSQPLRALSRP